MRPLLIDIGGLDDRACDCALESMHKAMAEIMKLILGATTPADDRKTPTKPRAETKP